MQRRTLRMVRGGVMLASLGASFRWALRTASQFPQGSGPVDSLMTFTFKATLRGVLRRHAFMHGRGRAKNWEGKQISNSHNHGNTGSGNHGRT